MAVVPVAYDIPEDILEGLASGALTRFGSVVRDRAQIIAHLKEVPLPGGGQEMEATSIAAALKNPQILIGLGVVVAAAAGSMAFWAARKRKQAVSSGPSKYVENYNASLGAYLEAVRNGRLDADIVDRLVSDLDVVAAESDGGRIAVEFSTEQSEALVKLVVDYTRKLAEANSVDLKEIQETTSHSEGHPIVDLRRYLDAQRQIFAAAA